MLDRPKIKYVLGIGGVAAAILLIFFFINVRGNALPNQPVNLKSTPTLSSSVGACKVDASDSTTFAISENYQENGANPQLLTTNAVVIYLF